MQNTYSDLINFEVKTSSSETFFNIKSVLYVQNVLGGVNMVSRGVLERYVVCCNDGVTTDVSMPCGRDVTSVILINDFLYLNIYLKNELIDYKFSIQF